MTKSRHFWNWRKKEKIDWPIDQSMIKTVHEIFGGFVLI